VHVLSAPDLADLPVEGVLAAGFAAVSAAESIAAAR
jgi:hypothetical protein